MGSSDYLSPVIALFLACGGLWLFADTLWWVTDERASIERNVLAETEIQIGTQEPCSTTVHLTAWNEMNKLGIYRWVAECEAKQ